MKRDEKRPAHLKTGEYWCLMFDEATGEDLGGVLVACCHTPESAAIMAACYVDGGASDAEHKQLRVVTESYIQSRQNRRNEFIVSRHCEWRVTAVS